jgi:membrane protein DedA with SNARE-associated domain
VPIDEWMLAAASSPWVYPLTALLIVADAFLVIVPSETVVVALGSLALSSGTPNVWVLMPVAAASAVLGDSLCYLIGRRIGTAWIRPGRLSRAAAVAQGTLERRAASVILTARYVPFARIAVNLTAGATGFAYRRFLPLSVIAGIGWACFNVLVGASFGALFPGQPLLGVALSVVVAIGLGVLIDTVVARVSAARAKPEPR